MNEKIKAMKTRFKILAIILTLGLILGLSHLSIPQPPPPSGHGLDENVNAGGNAPLGSGLILMLGMGAAYGFRKLYRSRAKGEE